MVVQADGERRLELMQWGLIPCWAKDKTIGSQCINARAETVATKPSFRAAFKARRCLVPAIGYYEWRQGPAGKQPFFITSVDDEPLAFAGLWESWTDKETGEIIRSYSILTCTANPFLSEIHDRMPAIVEPKDFETWFAGPPKQALELICPATRSLKAYPVSKQVNSPRNNSPELIREAA